MVIITVNRSFCYVCYIVGTFMMNLVDLIEMRLSSKVNRSFIIFIRILKRCSLFKRGSKVINLAAAMTLLVNLIKKMTSELTTMSNKVQ